MIRAASLALMSCSQVIVTNYLWGLEKHIKHTVSVDENYDYGVFKDTTNKR
jgi:hypothetical protein